MLSNAEVSENIKKQMVVLVSRVVTKYLKAFSSMKDVVEYHIPHQYLKEMEEKSNSVCIFSFVPPIF